LATDTMVVLIVEYEGTKYFGYQLQINGPTVQGEIEKALQKLTGENIRVAAASRTDAGVHAEGQVVSFRTGSALTLQVFVKGLNHYLPGDIAVKDSYRMSGSFNVRREAISREYNYYILNTRTRSPIRRGFAYLVTRKLDVEKMDMACRSLIGSHDFASFVTSVSDEIKTTIRTVYQAGVEKCGDLVIFNIVANSFLIHQVRNIVGPLVKVGLGKMTVAEFHGIIEAKTPGQAKPTAPACGLCLMRVNYPHPFGGVN